MFVLKYLWAKYDKFSKAYLRYLKRSIFITIIIIILEGGALSPTWSLEEDASLCSQARIKKHWVTFFQSMFFTFFFNRRRHQHQSPTSSSVRQPGSRSGDHRCTFQADIGPRQKLDQPIDQGSNNRGTAEGYC